MDGAKNFYFSTSQVVQRWCKNYVRYIDRTFAHTLSRSLYTRLSHRFVLYSRSYYFSSHENYFLNVSLKNVDTTRKKKERNDIKIMFVRLLFFFYANIVRFSYVWTVDRKESIRKLRRDCCCLTLIKSRCMRIYIYIFSEKSFFALLYL